MLMYSWHFWQKSSWQGESLRPTNKFAPKEKAGNKRRPGLNACFGVVSVRRSKLRLLQGIKKGAGSNSPTPATSEKIEC
jgi:hypothetical protein